jgi:hypothetical protein
MIPPLPSMVMAASRCFNANLRNNGPVCIYNVETGELAISIGGPCEKGCIDMVLRTHEGSFGREQYSYEVWSVTSAKISTKNRARE